MELEFGTWRLFTAQPTLRNQTGLIQTLPLVCSDIYRYLAKFSIYRLLANKRITLWAFILWPSHARVTSVMSVLSFSIQMDAFNWFLLHNFDNFTILFLLQQFYQFRVFLTNYFDNNLTIWQFLQFWIFLQFWKTLTLLSNKAK